MHITILLYENMTALDAIGPYEVFAHLPDHEVAFVARQAGPVKVDTGYLQLVASGALEAIERTDLLIIPGGGGWKALAEDGGVLDWVRAIHATTRYTASVCTGSLVLGAAGLLEGLRATTHWGRREQLRHYGATPSAERVVAQGKIITGAGVSAGIDMALTLLSRMRDETTARAVQLGIEYDPQPPFDSGSPEKAGAELTGAVRELLVW